MTATEEIKETMLECTERQSIHNHAVLNIIYEALTEFFGSDTPSKKAANKLFDAYKLVQSSAQDELLVREETLWKARGFDISSFVQDYCEKNHI
jgi:hypothetical protein